MEKALEATPDKAVEIIDSGAGSAMNQSKMDALIHLAENADKLGAALDKIRAFVLKRAMPGDFVRFGDKVELAGPGAERVAAALGIGFTNWSCEKTEWKDDHGAAYTWRYTATAHLGNRVMEQVEGRASSRSKFFGYEKGAWKELSDVSEADIRTSARRSVIKEGVKLMLGIRSIPYDEAYLKEIGLDPKRIKTVEYGKRGETKVEAAQSGTPVTIKEVNPFSAPDKIENGKVIRKAYVRYDVIDTEGRKASTFDKKVAEFAQKMIGKKVLMPTNATAKGVDIVEIAPYTEPATDQEPNT